MLNAPTAGAWSRECIPPEPGLELVVPATLKSFRIWPGRAPIPGCSSAAPSSSSGTSCTVIIYKGGGGSFAFASLYF